MRLTSLALAFLTIPISTPIASAACNPPKFASTYTYLTTTIALPNATLVGRIWSGATDNTGTCNDNGYAAGLYMDVPGYVGLALTLGNPCVVGCPSGSLSLDARVIDPTRTRAQMLLLKVPEHYVVGPNFDFSDVASAMCDVPRPAIDDLHSNGNTRTVHLSIGSIPDCGNAVPDITGWKILSAASSTDPGIFGSYDLRGSLVVAPGANGAASGSVSLDCSNASLDQWVTAQVVTNGVVSHLVGPTTRVACTTSPTQCSGVPHGTVCDDGDACTFHDTCSNGACQPGAGPPDCNDNDLCTIDSCDSALGCVHAPNACDPVACQTGTCDPTTGTCHRTNLPDGTSCDDGDACTTNDTCSGGTCHAGTPLLPAEVQHLSAADKATYSWDAVAGATSYDAVRGSIALLPVGPDGGDEQPFCGLSSNSLVDPFVPPPDGALFYISRAKNACGTGSYGNDGSGTPRETMTCP